MWKWIKELPPMSKAALAAGVGALCAAAAMNIVFGQTLAATSKGQIIYSAASFVCAVAGTLVFGMMTGRLLREKRWAACFMPLLILALATAWDIVSVMGFNATERLSAAANRQEAITLAKDETAMRKRYAEKLMGVATIRGNGISRAERREFVASASAEIGKVASAHGPRLLPDALAELLARYSGRSVEDIQLALIVYMSILLILIQSAGFTFTTYFDDRAASAASDPKDDASGGGRRRIKLVSGADDAERKPAVKSAMQPEYSGAEQPRSAASVNRASAPVHMPDSLSDYLHQYAQGQWPRRAQTAIARDFGVSQPTVSRQLRRAQERAERKRARSEARMTMHGGYGGGMLMHAPPTI